MIVRIKGEKSEILYLGLRVGKRCRYYVPFSFMRHAKMQIIIVSFYHLFKKSDEMFRLTTIKMTNWSLAAKMAKTAENGAGAGGAAMGTMDKKGGKKDKPNLCQPSNKKNKEKKKETKPAVVI